MFTFLTTVQSKANTIYQSLLRMNMILNVGIVLTGLLALGSDVACRYLSRRSGSSPH